MSTTLVPSDPITVGRRLRRARDQAGMSAGFAARRLGVPRQLIDALERGRDSASLETLVTLAQLYDRHLQWLLTGPSDMESDGVSAEGKKLA